MVWFVQQPALTTARAANQEIIPILQPLDLPLHVSSEPAAIYTPPICPDLLSFLYRHIESGNPTYIVSGNANKTNRIKQMSNDILQFTQKLTPHTHRYTTSMQIECQNHLQPSPSVKPKPLHFWG